MEKRLSIEIMFGFCEGEIDKDARRGTEETSLSCLSRQHTSECMGGSESYLLSPLHRSLALSVTVILKSQGGDERLSLSLAYLFISPLLVLEQRERH